MAITIVQSPSTSDTGGSTTTLSTTMTSVTAGNVILVILFVDKASGTINAPTSSGATTYTQIQKASLTSVSGSMYYKVANGGETVITQTWTTSQRVTLLCLEISGLNTTSPLDVSAMTATGNTVVKTISTGTTGQRVQDDEYAVAVMMVDTYSNVNTGTSWSNGFTLAIESDGDPAGGGQGGQVATKTLSAPQGTVETTFSTTATGDQMMAIVAVFKTPWRTVDTSGLLSMVTLY